MYTPFRTIHRGAGSCVSYSCRTWIQYCPPIARLFIFSAWPGSSLARAKKACSGTYNIYCVYQSCTAVCTANQCSSLQGLTESPKAKTPSCLLLISSRSLAFYFLFYYLPPSSPFKRGGSAGTALDGLIKFIIDLSSPACCLLQDDPERSDKGS